MTARAVWAGIAVALVVLPALPLPDWAGATDTGPAAWGHSLAAWAWGGAILAVVAGLAGRLARASALRTTVRFPHIPTRVFLGALALWIAAWAVALGRIGFAANPHLIDEIAQLFQARVFADGRLAAPQPALPEFFLFQLSSLTAAGWVTEFPPGHGLLLAGGLLGRAEWLVNPLLAGLCLPLVYALARGLYGPKTGRVAAFLWATCAWVGFMAGSYMNHMSAVFWALIAWVAVFGAGRSHHAVAGFALAALFATRPLDAVIAGWWALGAGAGPVERAYRTADLCDLSHLLARARADGRGGGAAALESLLAVTPPGTAAPRVPGALDPTLRLRPERSGGLPIACARELLRDRDGFASYGAFAWRNAPALDRGLVFARDLFERDTLLATAYGGWPVWRLRPTRLTGRAEFILELVGTVPEVPRR